MRDFSGFGLPVTTSHEKCNFFPKTLARRKMYNTKKQRKLNMQSKMLITFSQPVYLDYF